MSKKNAPTETTTEAEWTAQALAAGTAAWEATLATYRQLQDKTRAYSQATNRAVHEKPYWAMGAAFGVGVLIGYLATRDCRRNELSEESEAE